MKKQNFYYNSQVDKMEKNQQLSSFNALVTDN